MKKTTREKSCEETVGVDDPVVAISINRQYPRSNNDEDLYQATRGIWRLKRGRADMAWYAFAVYRGVIKEVYEITQWAPASEETKRYWRERERLQGDDYSETHEGRSEFEGRVAPEDIREKYVGKLLPKRHAGNPILYFNC